MGKHRKSETKSGWHRMLDLLPPDWDEMAFEKKAMSYYRNYSPESLLRSIFIYLSGKASLQDTVFQTMLLDMSEVSPEAFHNRFRKSGDWLHWMAEQTMRRNLAVVKDPNSFRGHRLRIIDATVIKQPGTKVGQYTWRLHFSLHYPSQLCTEFHLTLSQVGESFRNFDIVKGDLALGDRIYARPNGIAHVVDQEGDVLVRVMPSQFPLLDEDGERIDLLARLKSLRRGKVRNLDVQLKYGTRRITGRICALKLSPEAARKAKKRAMKASVKAMRKIRPETLEAAEYLILFTTLPISDLSAREAIDLYRFRWQAETNFKRAKSIFGLGALPCREEDSVKAWIYGKLLLHFLTKRNIPETGDFPPSAQKGPGRNKSVRVAGVKGMVGHPVGERETGEPSH